MSTGLAGPQGWGRPLPVPGQSPLPTPHVPHGASRVINPQSSPQCYPLGREREATLTTQAWNRNTGPLGLGRRKPVAYVEGKGKKKKGICPIALKSKLIHKTTSGGNDLRSRGHQTLHVLSVEDTVSQAKGSPATAGRWPGTQPASENQKATRACFCFSLCT